MREGGLKGRSEMINEIIDKYILLFVTMKACLTKIH